MCHEPLIVPGVSVWVTSYLHFTIPNSAVKADVEFGVMKAYVELGKTKSQEKLS